MRRKWSGSFNKLITVVYQLLNSHKSLVLFLLIIFSISGLSKGTYTWVAHNQRALNIGQTTIEKKDIYLQKYERNLEGQETTTPIVGTTFYLYQIGKNENRQIGGTYETNSEGRIQIQLAAGEYYFEEVTPSLGYTFDTDSEGKQLKHYPFKVTATSESKQPIVVAYNPQKLGSIFLEKTVKNADGTPLTEEQTKQNFDFQVTFSDKGQYAYRIDGGEQQWLTSGETIKLAHGQKATFEGIPIGVQYIVTEKAMTGYQASATNSSGTVTEKGTLISFVNTYDASEGQLDISKEVVNADGAEVTGAQKKEAFEFTVTFSDPNTHYTYTTTTGKTGTLGSGDSLTLIHGEHALFSGLPIGLTYDVTEKNRIDYTGSSTHYSGRILSKETVKLPFINQYKLDKTQTGSLLFDKQVVADQIDSERSFTFILTFSDNGNYEYQKNETENHLYHSGDPIQLTDKDQLYFPTLPAGVDYTIEEQPIDGYCPQLSKVQGTILSNQVASYHFRNYQEETANLIVKKIGEGEGFDSQKEFTFTVWINEKQLPEVLKLKAGESSAPLKLKVGDSWRIVETNVADDAYDQTELLNGAGVVTTPNRTITVSQTNRYTGQQMIDLTGKKTWSIPEGQSVNLPDSITVHLKSGKTTVATEVVTGPEWTYHFHVPKVAGDGKDIHYTIEESPVRHFKSVYKEGTLDITNVYVSPVMSRALPIEKRITSLAEAPEKEETFEFRLSPTKQVASINGVGKSSFEPITYTQAGTYVYTITERNKGRLGYTYDSSVYIWTVVVEEKENQLVITSETLMKDGELRTPPVAIFDNQYDSTKLLDEKIKIEGKKTWNLRDQPKENRPKAITVLLKANDKVVYQREVSEADDWSYVFNVNARDEQGNKITYSIDELAIPGYQKAIKGYNLVNTYVGDSTIQDDDPSKGSENPPATKSRATMPNTGEKYFVTLAIIGMLIILVAAYIWFNRKRKNK